MYRTPDLLPIVEFCLDGEHGSTASWTTNQGNDIAKACCLLLGKDEP